MAAAVRQFGRENPSEDPGYALMLTGLEELVARAEALAGQEIGGRVSEAAAIGRRDQLRHRLHFLLLRHLVRTAELAVHDHPELLGRFPTPNFKVPNSTYLITARKLLQEGRAQQEVLASYGLSVTMQEELVTVVDQFAAAIEEQRTGRVGHIGARAELEAICTRILQRVAQLDSFNRSRFTNNPERLAGWENVRTVLGLDRAKPESGDEPPPEKAEPAA